MKDVQNGPAEVAVPIDRVGVRGVTLPLLVRDRERGKQHTVAEADLGVELPAAFKGTHMSRFVEALENFDEELDYHSLKKLLEDIKSRLRARKSYVLLRFPYFMRKAAPVTGSSGQVKYDCRLTGELDEGKITFLMEVDVPVMTVCPCSKAISEQGAHSQRALVRMAIRTRGFSWLEDFIEIAERSGSSPVYTLLKREDEKYVTEHSFANPSFVEDVVRNVADQLMRHPHIEWFRVEVESFESIHAHNAFARIERQLK